MIFLSCSEHDVLESFIRNTLVTLVTNFFVRITKIFLYVFQPQISFAHLSIIFLKFCLSFKLISDSRTILGVGSVWFYGTR